MTLYEALDLFEQNIDDIAYAIRENIRDGLTEFNEHNRKLGTSWVAREVGNLVIQYRIGDLIKRHNCVMRYVDARRNPAKGRITTFATQAAKLVPIQDLFSGKLVKRGRKLWGCCPFHTEKTASFVIDTKFNTWHCFGACSNGGDSIDFYMRLHNVSFIKAVTSLI